MLKSGAQATTSGFASLTLISVIIVSVTACQFSPAQPTESIPVVCSELDCSDVLTVKITGTMPEDYTVKVVDENGMSMQVRCIDGSPQNNGTRHAGDPDCTPSGAAFYDFAPDEVSVFVAWDGNEYSETKEPEYMLHYPNGPNCRPVCRSTLIELAIGPE